jgi:hypothetical protein
MYWFAFLACFTPKDALMHPTVTTAAPCDARVVSTLPTDGDIDVVGSATVEFHLSHPDPAAEVITHLDGESWWRDETTLVFSPSEPLLPETEHHLGMSFCGGEPTVSFTTNDVGLPLEVPTEALVGRTYVVDLSSGRHTQGQGLMTLVASYVSPSLLMEVTNASATSLDVTVAVGRRDAVDQQDYCGRTSELKVSLDDPWLHINEALWEFPAYDRTLPLWNLRVDAGLDPTGTRLSGVQLATTIDTRDLLALLDDTPSVSEGCELAEFVGLTCGPCPDDGVVACVSIAGDQYDTWLVDDGLEAVEEQNEHPECEPWWW